jgi:hypothetical protein
MRRPPMLRQALAALFLGLSGLLLTALPLAAQNDRPAADADVVMVLDASNSMWGRIDGKPKIVVARRVIAELIADWDPTTHLGLVAYSHRRQGDCTDIETVVPVGEVDADSVVAGSDFTVSWQGPDNRGDYITIVTPDAPEGEYGNYTRTREGNPLSIRAPDQPGSYELRYLTGQTNATLASAPLTVSEATASLEAPSVAEAGGDIAVTRQGPDNRGDYVTIVEAGAPEGGVRRLGPHPGRHPAAPDHARSAGRV